MSMFTCPDCKRDYQRSCKMLWNGKGEMVVYACLCNTIQMIIPYVKINRPYDTADSGVAAPGQK